MKSFRLINEAVKRNCLAYIASLPSKQESPLVVTVKEAAKSREQEEKYHALIGEIAVICPIHGRLWDAESMKRILVDQFWRDTRQEYADLWGQVGEVRSVPSIDGSGIVSLGAQTRKFPKRLGCVFIEWLEAFKAQC
jgi:hypothetical protein